MPGFDSKKEEFAHQLDRMVKERGQNDVYYDQTSDLQSYMKSWEDQLDQRLTEYRGETHITELPPEPPAPEGEQTRPWPPFSHPADTLEEWLSEMDAMMLTELGLNRFPIPAGLATPVRFLADNAAMQQAIAQACQIDEMPELSQHKQGALHLPGIGTLINREHFAHWHSPQPSADIVHLEHAEIVAEVALERWGWGYILEYTSLGRQAVEAGLFPGLLSCRLGLQTTQPLAEALSSTWTLLIAGWQDWVSQFVLFKARHAVGNGLLSHRRPGRMLELVQKVVNLFPLYIYVEGVRLRLLNLLDLIRFLFLEESDILTKNLHKLLLQTNAVCQAHDAKMQELTGYTISQVLGMLYFARLESRVGIQAIPYAVLIATYPPDLDLRHLDRSSFTRQVEF